MNQINYITNSNFKVKNIIYKYIYFNEKNIIKYNVITNNPIYNECIFGSMFSYYISKCNNIGHSINFINKMLKINYHL